MSRIIDSFEEATVSPCRSTQELIGACVADWLAREAGVHVESIDGDMSLFELGVDSLGAASIAADVETATRKKLNPEVIFELETINELADYVDSLKPHSASGVAAPAGEKSATLPADETADETAANVGDCGGLMQQYAVMNRRINAFKQRDRYFFAPEISEHDGAWVVADGKRMLMLGSYEYLGLLGHPHLKQSAISTIEKLGTGHHGARLLMGTTSVHRQLEARLADLMQTEDAIVYSSGYVTNLATISTLVGRGDCVIGDQWNHASITDGCRLSGADFLEFRHNDMDSLAATLVQAAGRKTLVVVDSVFSMDGDLVDLPATIDLCKKHGALLMVDEAHSLGVLGQTGRGVQEHFGLDPGDIDIKMGTLSKTLAGSGGFVAACEEITTFLRHHARGYIFSGALPAGQASVAIAALEVIEREPELVQRLRENLVHYLSGLKKLGFDTANSVTPIVPVMTKNEENTLEMTRLCRNEGLLVIPVAYPAVPIDAPRLRTCVSAIHTREEIDWALDVLARAGRQTRLIL